MRRHRRGILATIAAVGMLVGAALIVVGARATQPTPQVTTTILAKSLFDEIHVRAHTPAPWKA